jgi:hypothetical protein
LEQALQYIKAGTWPLYVLTDPYFNYVTMLLHGDGTNGAQNNTFLDSSTNNFTITRNGNTTQGSFSPYGSNWSNYFSGSGDYLSGIGTTSSFNFMHNSTALFTAECWVYVNSLSSIITLFDNTNSTTAQTGITSQIYTNGTVNFFITYGSTGRSIVDITTTGTVTVNQWTHIAFVYDQSLASNNGQIYINGVLAGSGNKSGNTPSSGNASNAMRVGCYGNGTGQFMNGYISNLRIVNAKVYTSAFTPSTTPLTAISGTSLLTCQSNRFIDTSTNNFAITVNGTPSVQRFSPFSPSSAYSTSTIGGSGYFDGSGDYLNTPATGQFAPAGDFTIGVWYYPTTNRTYQQILGNYDVNSADVWIFEITNGTGIAFYTNGGTPRISGANKLSINAWNYIALVRSGTTITGYVNGASVGTYTQSGTFGTATKSISIGRGGPTSAAADYGLGYISDVIFVDGTATTSIPSAPSTAVSGTKTLLNFTNGAIFDNAMMNNLETVGNAQISTSVFKFGTGSLAFDGSGDYLVAANTPNISIATGDFTIEFWLYWNSVAGQADIVSSRPNTSAQTGYVIYLGTNYFGFVMSSNGSSWDFNQAPAFTWSSGTWYHCAVTRSGSNIRYFVNGTQVGNTYTYLNSIAQTNPLVVGGSPGGNYLNGYIDDLRVTKGYARYTSNFTPPAAAFPNQ